MVDETQQCAAGASARRRFWFGAGRQTLESYVQHRLAAQVRRTAAAAAVEVDLRRHILPTVGARVLASVRPRDVQAWVRESGPQRADLPDMCFHDLRHT